MKCGNKKSSLAPSARSPEQKAESDGSKTHHNRFMPYTTTKPKLALVITELDVGGAEKCLVNVGSVGQPRDGNPLSCYVLLDDDIVHFRRVAYDREKTIEKIYAIAELDDFLGDRLREGR